MIEESPADYVIVSVQIGLDNFSSGRRQALKGWLVLSIMVHPCWVNSGMKLKIIDYSPLLQLISSGNLRYFLTMKWGSKCITLQSIG